MVPFLLLPSSVELYLMLIYILLHFVSIEASRWRLLNPRSCCLGKGKRFLIGVLLNPARYIEAGHFFLLLRILGLV